MTADEEKDFTAAVYKLLKNYRTKIGDVNWETFEETYEAPQGELYQNFHTLSLIHQLFSTVKYQFENTARGTAYREFGNWFKTFVKSSYFKLRGSLGGSLKIDRDLLLMMTELSIMSQGQDKILVTKLWEQLERRGIYFDEKTKQAVIAFFGKINTLEKKSDSGDAQYVKRLYGNPNGK
jgi:DNA phosphorothioation-dependent restriction protein DptG